MDLRWYTKKAARHVVSYSEPLGRLERVLDVGPRVRVLTYHRFSDRFHDPFAVAPQVFSEHLAWLKSEDRLVSLQDLEDFTLGKRALRDGSVVITMDDGQRSMLTAGRILERYKAPAVAFITAGLIGTDITPNEESFMTWDEVRELQAMDVTIGSHAFTHRSVGKLTLEDAKDELLRSRAVLEENLGTPVRAFAYPFGTHGDFTAATDDAARAAGYALTFHSKHGAIARGRLLPSYPRIKVESGESIETFKRLVNGGMDAWKVVDNNLYRLQRVREELVR